MPTRIGRRGVGASIGLLSAVAVLGPTLAPGYLLRYDMVFVPEMPWNARLFGTDGSVPRAVPSDFLAATLGLVMPGWVAQKLLLIAVFVLLGVGFAGLMRSRLAAAAAALTAIWSPYLAERLSIGHWPYLLGYACLPFVLAAAADWRDRRSGPGRLALWLVAVSLTGSTSALMAGVVVLVTLLLPGHPPVRMLRRLGETVVALGLLVLLNATWWYAYLFPATSDAVAGAYIVPGDGDALVPTDRSATVESGVAAFRARADSPWGVWGSLVTGGGSWNPATWPAARGSLLLSGLALLLVVVALALVVRARATWLATTTRTAVLVSGVVGFVLAGFSAAPGGTWLMGRLVDAAPGLGLLRDAQKFSALWMLVVACAVGDLAQHARTVAARVGAPARAALGAGLVVALLPVVLLSGIAWGWSGQWRAVQYPDSVTTLAERIDDLPAGTMLVLPWSTYRQYTWNDDTVLLDPWQRLVRRDVIVDDSLPLSGNRYVPGDTTLDLRLAQALGLEGSPSAAGLRSAGVRYVLVQPGATPAAETLPGTVVAQTAAGRVIDLGAARSGRHAAPHTGSDLGWWLAGAGVLIAFVLAGHDARRHRRGARHT